MTDRVSEDETVELQYKLEISFRTDIALSSLLDAIISVPGFWSAASLVCLLNTYRDGYIRDNQDDVSRAITAQINAWAFSNQSILKERVRQATENLLKQPEQGIQCQIWGDDQMTDECLCAMYDASFESSGK